MAGSASHDEIAAMVQVVVQVVLRSRKYANVERSAVERLARRALQVQGKSQAEAIDAVKRALHQAYGAFGGGSIAWPKLQRELRAALSRGPHERREGLRALMRHHASTKERAPIVERFYGELFEGRAPRHVLDLGCGLNALSLPFWPQGLQRYHGVDLDRAQLDFVAELLDALPLAHSLTSCDLLADHEPAPLPQADVALLLKLVPTLEAQTPGSGASLIERVPASRVVVSFPARALGRRERSLEGHHRAQFEALCAERHWRARELRFDGELVYILDKPGTGVPAGRAL